MNMCKAEEAVPGTEGHFVCVSSHHFCQKWPSPKDSWGHTPLTALLGKEDAVTGPLSRRLSFILSSVSPRHLSFDWPRLMPASPAPRKGVSRQWLLQDREVGRSPRPGVAGQVPHPKFVPLLLHVWTWSLVAKGLSQESHRKSYLAAQDPYR